MFADREVPIFASYISAHNYTYLRLTVDIILFHVFPYALSLLDRSPPAADAYNYAGDLKGKGPARKW